MKLIAITIFCLVLTETITGTSITDSEKHPEASPGNNADTAKNSTEVKVPEVKSLVPPQTDIPSNTTNSTTTTRPTSTTPSTTITTKLPTPNTSTTTTPVAPSTKNDSSTTVPPPTAAPTDNPAHKTDRKFDSFSFIAGIVMAAGLMAIGLVAFKFYEARRDRNYHTI